MRALIVALGLMAAPAATAQQFDLVCKTYGKTIENLRIRVDLEKGLWCQGDCTHAVKIQAIEPNRLVFVEHNQTYSDDTAYSQTVDRTTGEYIDSYYSPGRFGSYSRTEGKCEPVPFSGIPLNQKF